MLMAVSLKIPMSK
jgi:hypothetical protein